MSLQKLVRTDASNYAALLLRITIACVILPHGLQKTLGLFGGPGFQGMMEIFEQNMHLPAVIAFLVILGESVGALSILLGFLTRFCAASLFIIIGYAAVMVHGPNGFFMSNNGFEFHMLFLGSSLALIAMGGGAWSVDAMLMPRKRQMASAPAVAVKPATKKKSAAKPKKKR